MQQKQIENLKFGLKKMPEAFSNPIEAKRTRAYLRRQAWQSLYRTIEIMRGERK
jgi:hypothetical protein